ncbi:type II toxin-antitoxin system RelE/ParE family toxin [Arcobacter porcinus]|uniref:Toxin-antitoxin system, toxin component, YafQ family n=1 Tax=Arcobacter porcinus TaxID=1935204 RepID=A0A5C2HB55_9BACT|nr:type II toxin-antitoxin system YafQ family toxin [Arcobacter porcinus]OCL81863.1 mRNA interferase YafQ [Arcobacter porcinus]OCL87172.1 mRNA interferase YafQ [Arcobacter porcinus]OCL89684.1 mRNA interferase YafQ [Aliarcobacter thereius]QEP40136.1 toxin-antitoxin system, toxin component, YafQ family [Arcobacter porcinus]
MLDLKIHKIFTKDLKKAQLNSTNSSKLFLYISLLLNNKELPKEAKNHSLKGEWEDTMEFHISGDLIVIYIIDDISLQLLRIGTHSQLFKKF